MSKKLLLYVNKSKKRDSLYCSQLLFPFWGIDVNDRAPFTKATFESLSFDDSYYGITDNVEEADVVFIPHNYWDLKKRDRSIIDWYVEFAQKHNKPILIDAFGDTMKQINIPNSIVIRLAQYRTRINKNDVIVPVYVEDLAESYYGGQVKIMEKEKIPTIGFSGWSYLPFFKYYRTYLKDLPYRIVSIFYRRIDIFRKGIFLRRKVLDILENSKLVKSDITRLGSFSGHVRTLEEKPEVARKRFIEKIMTNNYSLCVRGDANASTRFYEILSLGKIPVVIDTEGVFPLEQHIKYKDFCVFVDHKNVKDFPKIVADFHSKVSQDRFAEMQKMSREAFRKYLRIDSYTKYLVDEIRARL